MDALSALRSPFQHAPHRFKQRKHGSPEACEICGARIDDPIHIGKPRPGDG